MKFLIGYGSDKGIVKEENQDSLLIKTAQSPYGRIGFFIVCDGMGGLSSGEVASSTVVRGFSKWFDEVASQVNFNEIDEEGIFLTINEEIMSLNKKIIDYGERKNERLGTTLSLLLTVDYKYFICQIGDSRIYCIDNDIEQLTKDQTYVQREIDRGNITNEEGENHPKKNVLLQCIGVKKDIEPVFSSGLISDSQVFLICSDGLYKKIDDFELVNNIDISKLINDEQLYSKANKLINLAKSRKERDNITSLLVKVLC